jgi:hypothetical protein
MKHLLAFILICYSFNGNYQIDKSIKKGDIVLGGSSGFAFSKNKYRHKVFEYGSEQYSYRTSNQKHITISFSPLFGYFVTDGLVIGISPSYSYSQVKFGFSGERSTKSMGISPFIKYYFNNGFFTGLESGYSYSIENIDKIEYNSLSFKPSVGYAFFVNSKVSIEPSLEYYFSKVINETDIPYFKINELLFSVGFHIFL